MEIIGPRREAWRPSSGLSNGRWRVVAHHVLADGKKTGLFDELKDKAGRLRTFATYEAAEKIAAKLNEEVK